MATAPAQQELQTSQAHDCTPPDDHGSLSMIREIWEAGVEDNPVQSALLDYERSVIPAPDYGLEMELRLYIQGESDELLGGAIATTRWNALNILSLWVDESLRGQGFGSALVDELEEQAAVLGCERVLLETSTAHSYEFYNYKGFELVGYVDGYPAGGQYYYLHKIIEAVDPAISDSGSAPDCRDA